MTGDGVAAEVMELSGGYDGGKYKYDINVDNDTVMNMYPIQLVQSPCWNWKRLLDSNHMMYNLEESGELSHNFIIMYFVSLTLY